MRTQARLLLTIPVFVGILLVIVTLTQAQQGPGGRKSDSKNTETAASFVNRLMSFNKAKDGKLTKEELTDKRLHALFDRADANKDGVVTKEEMEALFARETIAGGGERGGPGGDGPKGKNGGKGRGVGGPPQPGQILPPFLQNALNLTDTQRSQIAELQKDVDAKLAKILTDEQRQRLRNLRDKGPAGFGPPRFGDKKARQPEDRKGPPDDRK